MGLLLHGLKQHESWNAQCPRKLLDALQRSVSRASLDMRNECAVQFTFEGERFLSEASLSTKASHIPRE